MQTDNDKAKKERWMCHVEFVFDVDTEPSKQRHERDVESDFDQRAFYEGLSTRLVKAFPYTDNVNWIVIPIDGRMAKREQ